MEPRARWPSVPPQTVISNSWIFFYLERFTMYIVQAGLGLSMYPRIALNY